MTEFQWLVTTDCHAMLRELERKFPSHVSERKLRLFACACCRATWHRVTDQRSRRAVEIAERYADGNATLEDLGLANVLAFDAHEEMPDDSNSTESYDCWACSFSASEFVQMLLNAPRTLVSHADILLDIVGNPFRAFWRDSWVTPVTLSLARAAYTELLPERRCDHCLGEAYEYNRFGGRMDCRVCRGSGRSYHSLDQARLSILADALEEAGCREEEILKHLRGFRRCPACLGLGTELRTVRDESSTLYKTRTATKPCSAMSPPCRGGWLPLRSPHVRGCWVVDLFLGQS